MIIKALAPDELDPVAKRLIGDAVDRRDRIVARAWMWAEVGSVLRKKIRARLVSAVEAERLWRDFTGLPIEYFNSEAIQQRAWRLASNFGFPTLYDAAFLACTELAPAEEPVVREYWTADVVLLNTLGDRRPDYVYQLGA